MELKVAYDLANNRLTFTTGTTGPKKSDVLYLGAARLGLDDLDVASGSTPVIFDLPSSAATIDGKCIRKLWILKLLQLRLRICLILRCNS